MPVLPLLILIAVLALEGYGGPAPEHHGQQPEPVPAPAPLLLRVDLPSLVPVGMAVPFRIALANTGERPVQVVLPRSSSAFDLIVQTPGGKVIWRRLEVSRVEESLIPRTLLPGEVLTFEDRWDQHDLDGRRVPPGVYQVRALLPVAGETVGWASPARQLTISP